MRHWSALGALLLTACGRGVWSHPGDVSADVSTAMDGGSDAGEILDVSDAPTTEDAGDASLERGLDGSDDVFEATTDGLDAPEDHGATDDGDAIPDGNVEAASTLPPCASGRIVFDEFPVPTPNAYAHGIVAGPDGAIWFTEFDGNKIGRVDQAGHVSEFPVPDPPAEPGHIAPGPDGNLWFTELYTGKIAHVDLHGGFVTLPTAYSSLYGITAGPDGKVWFTETAGIARISGEQIVAFPISEMAVGAGLIAAGLGGNLWFVEPNVNKIGRIATDGTHLAEFPVDAQTLVIGIAAGADGNLWFADYHGRVGRMSNDGQITTFVIPLKGSCPVGITATGCDVWYTDNCANQIGRLTLDGMLTELPVPTTASSPVFITAAPDGTIWFTENAGNQIGHIHFESTGD